MWITGLQIVKRKLGLSLVYDLSATPFFLRGSGYAEGTLFPWTMCDFSLMDAIECGIVKLPRVPVADNVPGGDTPMFRNLWEHIGKKMPKKGRGASGRVLDPLSLPLELVNAIDALYGHYEKTFELWEEAKIGVPPVFIIVCNNTSTSELIYKYVSGFHRDGVGKEGLTGYCSHLAQEQPKAFAALLGRVLPMQVTGADGDPFELILQQISGKSFRPKE